MPLGKGESSGTGTSSVIPAGQDTVGFLGMSAIPGMGDYLGMSAIPGMGDYQGMTDIRGAARTRAPMTGRTWGTGKQGG